MDKITRIVRSEEFEAMRKLKEAAEWSHDPEVAHSLADAAIIDFIRALGYTNLANMWEDVAKYYA